MVPASAQMGSQPCAQRIPAQMHVQNMDAGVGTRFTLDAVTLSMLNHGGVLLCSRQTMPSNGPSDPL